MGAAGNETKYNLDRNQQSGQDAHVVSTIEMLTLKY